jgi:hypothetical protein
VGTKPVPFPRRQKATLWLEGMPVEAAQKPVAEAAPDSLDLQVSRRIADGVPVLVTTHVALRVSGQPREVTLGRVLLGGDELLGVESKEVPVRIEGGVLVAQVRPGSFTLRVVSAFARPPEALVAPRQPEPWPAQETWLWQSAEHLRQVQIAGAGAIDPGRTTLPLDCRTGSAYELAAGTRLTLSTLRRGEADPPPNEIRLHREMWLAEDGESWKVQDHFGGWMRRNFRLDLTEGELGRFSAPAQDLLLTHAPGSTLAGVEVRQGSLDLVAEWILHDRTTVPAVGWSEDLRELDLTVNTPPGWLLVGATGVDDFDAGLLRNLSLPNLILIALVAIALGWLGRPWWGAIAGAGLLLGTQQWDLPLWPWVVALATLVVLRRVPWPAVRTVLWAITTVALLVLGVRLMGFVASYAEELFIPHGRQAQERHYAEAEAEQVTEENADNKEGGTGIRAKGEEGSMGNPNQRYAIKARYGAIQPPRPELQEQEVVPRKPPAPPKDVVLQMGPGMPNWKHRAWSLPISGPVKQGHVIRLTLLSPWQHAVLGVVEIGLLLFAFALALRLAWQTVRAGTKAGPVAAIVGGLLMALPGVARAELPSQSLLDELRTRLTRAPECSSCVSVSQLRLEIAGPTLEIESEVHVVGTQAYRLPGPASVWLPDRVAVDGRPTQALVLRDDGHVYVRLAPGKHVVRASGGVNRASLTLSLGTPPRRVDVQARGFSVAGLSDEGVPKGALELTRAAAATDPAADDSEDQPEAVAAAPEAPWLLVTRTFSFGVLWTVTTKLERVGPSGAAVGLDYPLLVGEKINDPTVLTGAGTARLSLDAEQTTREVTSTLPVAKQLVLAAVSGARASERWVLRPSEIWRCEHSGISPFVAGDAALRSAPEFAPWPGERLTVKLVRPEAAPGSSLALDAAYFKLDPGPRALEASLSLEARVSKAQPLTVTLPPGAEAVEVMVDQKVRSVSPGDVTLNLEPGGHGISVTWKHASGLGLFFRAPAVRLSHGAANVQVRVAPPIARQILWLGGPSWGSRTVIWIHWLMLIVLSLVLATLPQSPLPWWQWLVLGFGFVGMPDDWEILGLVVLWFFVVQARGRSGALDRRSHNARQVGLALLTLVAAVALLAPFMGRLSAAPRFRPESGYEASRPELSWYSDAITGDLPRPFLITIPDWLAYGVYLTWCAAIAYLCTRWGKWAWLQAGHEGLWLSRAAAASGSAEVEAEAGSPDGDRTS